MAQWPAGHRWEHDYQIRVRDNTLALLGTLGTVHDLSGKSRTYGQYKANCTFSLERRDPWASVLNQEKTHFIEVWRDGVHIWSGVQFKIDRTVEGGDDPDEDSGELEFIDFAFLPLSFIASWRDGKPVPPAVALTSPDLSWDDAFKWVVERTLGDMAPDTPTDTKDRTFPNFVVAANKSEHPDTVELKATFVDLYELLQREGLAKEVDWDIFFNDDDSPEFETWYPRRGLDKTEGNGARTEVIFTDHNGAYTTTRHSVNSQDLVTVTYTALMSENWSASANDLTNFLLREKRVATLDDEKAQATLAEHGIAVTVKLEDFVEQENCQWDPGGTADIGFDLGDLITWKSARLGFDAANDVISGIDWEIDADGYEHLTIILGGPEPDQNNKMRGGGTGKWTYDPKGSPWGLRGTAGGSVPPDEQNHIQLEGDSSIVITEVAGDNKLTFAVDPEYVVEQQFAAPSITFGAAHAEGVASTVMRSDATFKLVFAGDTGTTVPSASNVITFNGTTPGYAFAASGNALGLTGPWTRFNDTYDWLRTTTAGDRVMINAAAHPADIASADVRLYVDGHVQVDATVVATGAALELTGQSGIVHVAKDTTDAILKVLDASAAEAIFLHSASSSWFRGGGVHIENGHDLSMYSDTGTTKMAYWDAATGDIYLADGGDIFIETGGSTLRFLVDGATGNTTLHADASLTIDTTVLEDDKLTLGHSDYFISRSGTPTTLVSGGGYGLDLGFQGTAKIRLQSNDLFPLVANTVSIGTSAYTLKDIHLDGYLYGLTNTQYQVFMSDGTGFSAKTPTLTGETTGFTVENQVWNGAKIRYGNVESQYAYVLYWTSAPTAFTHIYTSTDGGSTNTWTPVAGVVNPGTGSADHYHELTGTVGGHEANAALQYAV